MIRELGSFTPGLINALPSMRPLRHIWHRWHLWFDFFTIRYVAELTECVRLMILLSSALTLAASGVPNVEVCDGYRSLSHSLETFFIF